MRHCRGEFGPATLHAPQPAWLIFIRSCASADFQCVLSETSYFGKEAFQQKYCFFSNLKLNGQAFNITCCKAEPHDSPAALADSNLEPLHPLGTMTGSDLASDLLSPAQQDFQTFSSTGAAVASDG